MEKFLNRQLDKIQLDLTQDKNVCFSKKKKIKLKLTSRRYPPYSGPVYYQDQTGFDPFFVWLNRFWTTLVFKEPID